VVLRRSRRPPPLRCGHGGYGLCTDGGEAAATVVLRRSRRRPPLCREHGDHRLCAGGGEAAATSVTAASGAARPRTRWLLPRLWRL